MLNGCQEREYSDGLGRDPGTLRCATCAHMQFSPHVRVANSKAHLRQAGRVVGHTHERREPLVTNAVAKHHEVNRLRRARTNRCQLSVAVTDAGIAGPGLGQGQHARDESLNTPRKSPVVSGSRTQPVQRACLPCQRSRSAPVNGECECLGGMHHLSLACLLDVYAALLNKSGLPSCCTMVGSPLFEACGAHEPRLRHSYTSRGVTSCGQ